MIFISLHNIHAVKPKDRRIPEVLWMFTILVRISAFEFLWKEFLDRLVAVLAGLLFWKKTRTWWRDCGFHPWRM
ncbi:MAG: hypothetical protein K0R92_2845, partial [Lachnospiraceae bacterium]|nr:hypothetical protein [Lachnospiraceae bacterium]